MSRPSDSFTWGIRWETVECPSGRPLYGATMPDAYHTRREARWRQRWLATSHPWLANPQGGVERRPVRYILFARRLEGRPSP
jgi:hypothetical protein